VENVQLLCKLCCYFPHFSDINPNRQHDSFIQPCVRADHVHIDRWSRLADSTVDVCFYTTITFTCQNTAKVGKTVHIINVLPSTVIGCSTSTYPICITFVLLALIWSPTFISYCFQVLSHVLQSIVSANRLTSSAKSRSFNRDWLVQCMPWHMTKSIIRRNRKGDNLYPWRTPIDLYWTRLLTTATRSRVSICDQLCKNFIIPIVWLSCTIWLFFFSFWMRAYMRPKILGMLGLSLLDGDVAESWNTLLLHICYRTRFGRSRSNPLGIDRRSQNFGDTGPPLPWSVGMADLKNASPPLMLLCQMWSF